MLTHDAWNDNSESESEEDSLAVTLLSRGLMKRDL